MKNIDLSILNSLIEGRVEPKIYAFSTNTVPNYLKVGDTYRSIEKRLNEWRTSHYPDLQKEYENSAKIETKDRGDVFFRDYAVHDFLEASGKERLNEKGHSIEFFKDTNPADIDNAIADIKRSLKENESKYKFYNTTEALPIIHEYARLEAYEPRPNQQNAINNFKSAIENGRKNLLMYAVMRFGKSFTSMCCAVEMGARFVVVVSAKADVKEEWKKTTQSHKKFEGFNFVSNDDDVETKLENNEKLVLFLTLQDLQGDKIKTKHKFLFSENAKEIDLLVIDESHFGARAKEFGKVLTEIDAKELEKQEKEIDADLESLETEIKIFKTKIRLHLSGTPYRILMGSEFTSEDIIAFCQFTDIVDEKDKWDAENLNNDNLKEWDNPYYGFPQMIRFALNPNASSIAKMQELSKAGISFAMSALFKPLAITKVKDCKIFKNEAEILDLFKSIDGSIEDENVLGFLDYDKIKEGNMCRHVVCVLPYKASCDALEALLKKNTNDFKNLSDYEIINISGNYPTRNCLKIEDIQNKIAKFETEGKKTLSLTVNKMLTGSTVKEWDTMLYFKDTSSPQEYDQAIFRLQNPYIKTYKEEDGDTIKYCIKPQTILVDFAPNRIFEMQEQKAQIYNVNVDKSGNDKLEERLCKELQVSPIVILNKDKIDKVCATDILAKVSEYSKNKSVTDEATSIPIDMKLLNIAEVRQEIERQAELFSKDSFKTNAIDNQGEGDDIEFGDTPSETPSNENNSTPNIPIDDKEKDSLEKRFATLYARILFFAFLTKSKIKSLENLIDAIEGDADNIRIAKNLELNIDVLSKMNKYMYGFTLSRLDYKIQNINTLSSDTELTSIQRAKNALNKFSRFSSSEIVTPQKVALQMCNTLAENADDIDENSTFLDIASKQGEFTIALLDTLGEKINKNNIYSIATSSVAYEFTRKMYNILGIDEKNVFENFNSYDIIKPENQINDLIKKSEIDQFKQMKFDVIIGNPPYQASIGTTDTNQSLSKQLFPVFIKKSISMTSRYSVLITPSRWFTADAQDNSFVRLREFFKLHNHLKVLNHYVNEKDIFEKVEIAGGISYFVYDKIYSGDLDFYESTDKSFFNIKRPLFEENLDIVLSNKNFVSILAKIKKDTLFKPLTQITQGRDAFGVVGKSSELNKHTTELPFKGSAEVRCAKEVFRYIAIDKIKKNISIMHNWKVFMSKANGGAGILNHAKPSFILGVPYIGRPTSVCTDSLIPIGSFKTEIEAINLSNYIKTKFLRFLVGILKVSQNIYQNVYTFVPLQDFTENSDIDWTKSISEIDQQLYKKYTLTEEEIAFIDSMIKPME